MADQFFVAGPSGRLSAHRYLCEAQDAEPLLLIMGVAGHHRMWGDEFLARLSSTFDVVTLDNRGIGLSHRADEPFTLRDLADDALAVMDHLGWSTAHVHGLSMGGTIAQILALGAPERVRSLILGGTWPGPLPGGEDVWGEAIMNLAQAATPGGDPMTSARLMFSANVSPTCAADEANFARFVGDAAAEKVPAPVIMMQMRAATAHDVNDQLPGLDIPTLVIHGEADAVIRPLAGQTLAALIPGAQLQLLPGVGHLFGWEDGSTADLLTAFIGGQA